MASSQLNDVARVHLLHIYCTAINLLYVSSATPVPLFSAFLPLCSSSVSPCSKELVVLWPWDSWVCPSKLWVTETTQSPTPGSNKWGNLSERKIHPSFNVFFCSLDKEIVLRKLKFHPFHPVLEFHMSPYCSCGVLQVSGSLSSPICLEDCDINIIFSAKKSTVIPQQELCSCELSQIWQVLEAQKLTCYTHKS